MDDVNEKPVRRTRSLADIADSGEDFQKIVIGVCAMDKKARSNPMTEIIRRLLRFGEFTIRIFGDEVILNRPVEEWPDCDCLFSWHSDKFPLQKAEKYVELRKPFLINDVNKQKHLRDRRKVYSMLKEAGIPLPTHIVVSRDDLPEGQLDPDGFVETEDYVEMNGRRIEKPFVEKPVSGDNHNIFIYYPQQMGGGIKCLFRKLNNRSAEYFPNHSGRVRRDGSFIYEEFLATGGTDVKVYTVGPRYAHAEARKSPVVDGVVQRTPDGKEVRFPILLDQKEKEIARTVTFAFGQKVCGFDLLRSDKGSFVCDVNGWSFVKSSYKYYEDAAGILRMAILSRLAPCRVSIPSRSYLNFPPPHSPEWTVARDPASFSDLDALGEEGGREWEELRCVLLVARHGDRTPKQKMKIKVQDRLFLDLFEKYKDKKGKQAKLKDPAQLQDLLDAARELLRKLSEKHKGDLHGGSKSQTVEGSDQSSENKATADENREKFRTLVTVLEAGGHFSGINRKVQLKPTRWSCCSGNSTESAKVEEVLLILKYGGILTHAGRLQAEKFGRHFRTTMYPGESGTSGEPSGGLLRLHSTYRHDLKIYSSDEGRVQTSAAAFAKGLLDLEGTSLTPILVSLVQKDTGMLDSCEEAASENIQRIKSDLYDQITWNKDKKYSMKSPASETALMSPPPSPPSSSSILNSSLNSNPPFHSIQCAPSESNISVYSETSEMKDIPNQIPDIPEDSLKMLYDLKALIDVLVDKLYELCTNEKFGTVDENGTKSYSSLSQDPVEWESPHPLLPCSGERLILILDRWKKLKKSFYNRRDQFDVSKIPDIYDSAKYDAIHNRHLNLPLEDLYEVARNLANLVIPGEYGTDPESKGQIGVCICSQLLGKLLVDLANTKEECVVTAQLLEQSSESSNRRYLPNNMDFGDSGFFDDFYLSQNSAMDSNIERKVSGATDSNEEASPAGSPKESAHRLCPTYAFNINSPLRHVRTRIYFTSESHIHALMNVLKYCRGKDSPAESMEIEPGILSIPEFDYLSHLVFRLYENPRLPFEDENRFRVEVLFSPGAAYNPFEQRWESCRNHVLPIQPRRRLHREEAVSLNRLDSLLRPWSTPRKVSQPFAWLTAQTWKDIATKNTTVDAV